MRDLDGAKDVQGSDESLAQEPTLIQIRERSYLDLLDLALLVVRHRPRTLALAAAAESRRSRRSISGCCLTRSSRAHSGQCCSFWKLPGPRRP